MAETDAELMVSIIAESDWESPFVIKEFISIVFTLFLFVLNCLIAFRFCCNFNLVCILHKFFAEMGPFLDHF